MKFLLLMDEVRPVDTSEIIVFLKLCRKHGHRSFTLGKGGETTTKTGTNS